MASYRDIIPKNFGSDFERVWPKIGTAMRYSPFAKTLLKQCERMDKPPPKTSNVTDFIRKSSKFPLEFGTNTCRVISQPKNRYPIISQQISSAYPIIHERVLGLYLNFLEHKCRYGTQIEKDLYTGMSLPNFVQRLLNKRCVTFGTQCDYYKLLSGDEGCGGFEDVGTENEKEPLLLKNVLSYDEIKLAAFLSVSSHSEFINDGNRFNYGEIEQDKSSIVRDGVIIGLIGPRFERLNYMESQDILITREQNTHVNGYGCQSRRRTCRLELPRECTDMDPLEYAKKVSYRRLWTHLYEQFDLVHDEARRAVQHHDPRFTKSYGNDTFFDNLLAKKRYALSFDTLLLEAETRAKFARKSAYIHVVGIGLGVWRASPLQNEIFLRAFVERVKHLVPILKHICAVHFSWFGIDRLGDIYDTVLFDCRTHPKGGIRAFLSDRNPAERLPHEYKDCLVVVSYAWDSNAYPGNEFWQKSLDGSGDPAAACSTLISELHNPHINSDHVNGMNLQVATLQHGVMHIIDYCRLMFLGVK